MQLEKAPDPARCRPTWAVRRPAPEEAGTKSHFAQCIEALGEPLLACETPDDLLDAFDEAVESVEFSQYVDAVGQFSAEYVVTSDERSRREHVLGSFAEQLDVVEGYNRASLRIWDSIAGSHLVTPFADSEVRREGLRVCFGNVAAAGVTLALMRDEPLPDWMARVLTGKLLEGVRAFLKIAALAAPEAVPLALLPETDRLDAERCREAAGRYAAWLNAG